MLCLSLPDRSAGSSLADNARDVAHRRSWQMGYALSSRAVQQTVEADQAVLQAGRLKLGYIKLEAPIAERIGAIPRERQRWYERRTEAVGCDLPLEQELRRSPSCSR
jgi:multidrug efflux pump subunit AcrA (membrane-fusion protein)